MYHLQEFNSGITGIIHLLRVDWKKKRNTIYIQSEVKNSNPQGHYHDNFPMGSNYTYIFSCIYMFITCVVYIKEVVSFRGAQSINGHETVIDSRCG